MRKMKWVDLFENWISLRLEWKLCVLFDFQRIGAFSAHFFCAHAKSTPLDIYVSYSMRPTDTWSTHLGIICETIWMVVCDHAALWSILSVSLFVLLSLFGCLFGTVAFWLAAHTKLETERNEKCSNPFTCQCIWWYAEISLNWPIFWA